MDTLENMRIFVRVVEAGSFTAAAQSLNVNTSLVSRAVADLERHLRARLLERTTRKLALTHAGDRYLLRCQQLLADLERAEEEASNASDSPRGTLRLFSFVSLGQHYVVPAIRAYRERYPEIKVELTQLQHTPDLYNGSVDVALVAAASLPDSDIISHDMGLTFNVLCASPDYLAQYGTPRTPDALPSHRCLLLKTPEFRASQWRLEREGEAVSLEIDGIVQINVAESMASALESGMGIGMLPIYSAMPALTRGTLVRVLPEYTLQPMHVYAMYASRQYVDAKTRTWIDFLRAWLPARIQDTARDLARF
ncbi:LysR family transcriptional regulator [Robbsia sp. KACC 23696]|uniref:LysR family transcriptional regulator n=1 Tax=Robbsia sp. KACC 23696 TaxID=3149231 RepID=UPI00325A4916